MSAEVVLCMHKTTFSASLFSEICHQFTNPFLNQFSSIFGGNCITAYQRKKQSLKTNLRLKSVHIIKMSEEQDDLKSIKVYKFNNTKENWHEFAHKFRVIADSRGYYGVIDGTISPPDKQEKLQS